MSCPNCFTAIAYDCEKKKHHIAITKEGVNCFEDYFEICDLNQLRGIISEEQFNELNVIDDEIKFINVKCSNCYNPLGIKDTLNKYFIFFNAI